MNLTQWAQRWGIPPEALDELALATVYTPAHAAGHAYESEGAVQSRVRIEAARKGVKLWRNNVGAGRLENGSYIRWGLANDSAALNKIVKSADLVGGRSMIIRPDHVGKRIMQFVSRECKAEGWTYKGTERDLAQLHWATTINSLGGDAAIVTGTGTL